MKKLLVIGAHSYIGQKFSEYVMQMDNDDITVELVSASNESWRQADFSLYDSILHLSGIVHLREKKNMESLYYKVNYKLAVEVAQRAKQSQVKQFIFMSTVAVFGASEGRITMNTLPNPTTYYGKSKLVAEQEINKLQDKDFHVVIVRPPIVYGEKCKGNYARLVRLAKYTPVFPNYHNKRSMLNVVKLSECLVELIKNESSGYIHPQDDEYKETSELVKKIRENMGKKTILLKGLDPVIELLIHKVNIIKKLFGDLYYEEEDV